MKAGKRALDLFGALTGLVVLWPLMLAIASLVKLDDGGPVFFRQQRVGQGGLPFRLWKFRTMVPEAPARGGLLTATGDPRVTRIGAWLRRLKLDELPQLFNVLAAEMSLVGPRPEVPKYVALYTQKQRRVLALTPGITDEASIRYCDESTLLAEASDPERLYVDQIMPDKIRINLQYAARATLWSDFSVILTTLYRLRWTPRAQIRKDGRDQAGNVGSAERYGIEASLRRGAGADRSANYRN